MPRYNIAMQEYVFSAVERASTVSSFVARTIEIAGNVAAYALWQKARGLSWPRFIRRESLWQAAMFPLLRPAATILEFGVASGAATRFWLTHIEDPQLRWHGYDAFTGLPTPWTRGGVEYSPAGRFDTGGVPPAIDDMRLTWHLGLVEDTLPSLQIDPGQIGVLFDLDLYEPTAVALRWLAERLHPGDLLYFDEIYDPWHERRALDEFLASGHRVRPLGTTGMAAAFEYIGFD